PAWGRSTTILVSDGGGHLKPKKRQTAFWPLQILRVLSVIDNQVRSQRKRDLLAAYRGPAHLGGTFWGIRTEIADYGLADVPPCPPDRTRALAKIPTRLAAMPLERQRRLVNWGYAVCDAGLRRWVVPGLAAPAGFPYPKEAV